MARKTMKISPACKRAAKKKFKVWPSAYASGWGTRCTKWVKVKRKSNGKEFRGSCRTA
jgi:hypothetical protein